MSRSGLRFGPSFGKHALSPGPAGNGNLARNLENQMGGIKGGISNCRDKYMKHFFRYDVCVLGWNLSW